MTKFVIYINSQKAEHIVKWLDSTLDNDYRAYFNKNDVSLGSLQRDISYVPTMVSADTYFRIKDIFNDDCGCPPPSVIDREQLTKDYLSAIGGEPEKTFDIDNQTLAITLDIAARIIEEKYRVEKR